MGTEIERRWLLDGRRERPWVDNCEKKVIISQYYLEINELSFTSDGVFWKESLLCKERLEGEKWVTARFRITDDMCIFTLKGKSVGASREEVEFETDPPSGINALPRLLKTRYYWRGMDGLLWEIDEFEEGLAGLIIGEVEIPKENHPIQKPEWLGMELTFLKGWSNADLVKMLSSQDKS